MLSSLGAPPPRLTPPPPLPPPTHTPSQRAPAPPRLARSVFTNEKGGIIDDTVITKVSPTEIYLVVNAGCRCAQAGVAHALACCCCCFCCCSRACVAAAAGAWSKAACKRCGLQGALPARAPLPSHPLPALPPARPPLNQPNLPACLPGCREKDLAHLDKHLAAFTAKGGDVTMTVHDDRGLLALQGPEAVAVLQVCVCVRARMRVRRGFCCAHPPSLAPTRPPAPLPPTPPPSPALPIAAPG